MAGGFRIAISNNRIPEIVGILRSRSNQAKEDLARIADETASLYERKLKIAAPKAPISQHELMKGITVTPVQATGTKWFMLPESAAPYTKFVIQGTKGNMADGRIHPLRYARNTGTGPKALKVYYAGHGNGFYYTRSVRPQKPNPFQEKPTRQATEYMKQQMTILGHKLISITNENVR